MKAQLGRCPDCQHGGVIDMLLNNPDRGEMSFILCEICGDTYCSDHFERHEARCADSMKKGMR